MALFFERECIPHYGIGRRVFTGSIFWKVIATRKHGGAVDTHGARDQWMCVFVYDVDQETQPAKNRRPMVFREVYLGHVTTDDFRENSRGRLGTRTATLDRKGILKIRSNWIYRINDT